MSIPTYQPSKKKRIRAVGFRKRNSTKDGKKILQRRRLKKRYLLVPKVLKYSK